MRPLPHQSLHHCLPLWPTQVLEYAHRFRLNENLAAAITRTSTAAGLALAPLLAVTAVVAAAAGSVLPFLVALVGAATAVAGLALAGQLESMQPGVHLQSKVRMRYAPEAAAAATPAALMTTREGSGSNGASDGGSSGGGGSGGSSGATAASTGQQGAQQEQQQRRPSAFTDVGSDKQPPPQPQAVPTRRQGSSGLRLRQPRRLQPSRLRASVLRSYPVARALTLSL